MKYLLSLLTITVLLLACTVTSKMSRQGINFQEGDDLIYEVNAKDSDGDDAKMEIELNINEVSEYGVSFDWEMSVGRSGTIYMNEEAIKNATNLSFFRKQGYTSFKDKTTIWLSQTTFKCLKNGEEVEIALDDQKVNIQMTGTETFNFGKSYNIPVIIVVNEDKTIELWIADDTKNPILVQMRREDFRMDLVDYKLFR